MGTLGKHFCCAFVILDFFVLPMETPACLFKFWANHLTVVTFDRYFIEGFCCFFLIYSITTLLISKNYSKEF